MRARVEAFDGDGGVPDMIDDYHQAEFAEGHTTEEMEASAKSFEDMFASAQKPLHNGTTVSQLDVVGSVMGFKSQFNLSRDAYDGMIALFGSMLPESHILPKNMYESQKLLGALKMPYEQIHCCENGCVLFRGEHKAAKYCPKCKRSRYIEVDSSDGQKRQLTIPLKVLRYLPFIPRLQRLFISSESAKQMTWHKQGTRYNPDKMVHPADGEAWTHFHGIHREKAREARNVRVAFATDGFNPFGMMAVPYTCWLIFVVPLNLPPGVLFQRHTIFLSLIILGHPGHSSRQSWRLPNQKLPGSQLRRELWPLRSAKASGSPRGGQQGSRRRYSVAKSWSTGLSTTIFGKRKKEKKKVGTFLRSPSVVDRALGEGAVPVKLRRDGVKVSPSGGRTLSEISPRARVLALGEELYADNLFSEQPSPTALVPSPSALGPRRTNNI